MLVELGKYGLNERDLVANINFFSKVVVDEAGALQLAAGHCQGRPVRRPAVRDGHDRRPARRAASAGHQPRHTRRRPSGCRRVAALRRPRTTPAGFAARRTRAASSTPKGCIHLEAGSTRWCPRANRGWVSCAAGQSLRIVDLEGNQAVDTLFYNAADTAEHYSAQNTIQAQGRIYLTTGTVLLSNRGNALLRIEEDTCGRHDTLGGACSAESNTVRYALEKRSHALLPRQFPAGAGAPRQGGADQARPALEHQLLHERAGDARRANCVSPTASPRRAGTCSCGRSSTRWC